MYKRLTSINKDILETDKYDQRLTRDWQVKHKLTKDLQVWTKNVLKTDKYEDSLTRVWEVWKVQT